MGAATVGSVLDVADDPDNLEPVLFLGIVIESDAFPERALIRPIASSHFLVDDDDVGSLGSILSVEGPSGKQRNSHRRKVIRRCDMIACRSFLIEGGRLPFDNESTDVFVPASPRQVRAHSG